MIKNFDEVKKQLGELSDVVNKFKSEAVQLKIVELVFAGAGASTDEPPSAGTGATPRRRARKVRKGRAAPSATAAENGKKRAATKAKGTGPMPSLEQFIQEGFFNQKRVIGAVVEHCRTKARHFKNTDLSGPLGRLVRDNKLSRTKNTDGQWEYIKK